MTRATVRKDDLSVRWAILISSGLEKSGCRLRDVPFIRRQRTNSAGAQLMKTLQADEFTAIEVRHNDLHLDVVFTVVGRKLVFVHRMKLDVDFLEVLASLGYGLLDCAPAEQGSMACNVVADDDREVIAHVGNVSTKQIHRTNGVKCTRST